MPFMTVYYFQDTSDSKTCKGNVCQTMEGWYDDYPRRPHGGKCDCPISKYVGYAEYIYKNFQESDGGDFSRSSTKSTTYPNPHPTEDLDASITITFTVKRNVKVAVEEIMEHFGFEGGTEETMSVTRVLPVKIPPKHEARVEAKISGSTTHFSAERWATFTNYYDPIGGADAPEQGEIYVGVVQGGILYEENSDVEFEVELTPI